MKIFNWIGMECLGLELKLLCLKLKHSWSLLCISELREERGLIGEGEDLEWSRRAEIGNELNTRIRHCHYLESQIKQTEQAVNTMHKASS